MNLAFRFPASLSVTIGHHAVSGEGPLRTPKFMFLGTRAKKMAFFSKFPKI